MTRRNVARNWLLAGMLVGLGLGTGRAQRTPKPADFEHVSVDSARSALFYEQRLYRNPMAGLLTIQQVLPPAPGQTFVPLHQGVPIARYGLTPFFRTSLMSRQERRAYARAVPFRPSRYRFDVRLQPDFTASFGYRERPIQSKTNLLLQSQLHLTRGLVLNGGVLIPILNDLDNQPRNVRPAPVYLNQFLALDHRNFLSLSAGLFYNDQGGINVQYRRADLTRPWSFGLEAGLTGFYYFLPDGFYYQRPRNLLLIADAAYRLPVHNLTVKVSGGQYLSGDRGGRLEVIRQFPNVEIGFFMTKTTNGSTGGFNFAIPIPPGRIAQSQRLRLRTTEEYRWEYNYSRGYNIALRYRLGTPLDALLRQYHHDYLRSQLAE